jgi:hypothetical protein
MIVVEAYDRMQPTKESGNAMDNNRFEESIAEGRAEIAACREAGLDDLADELAKDTQWVSDRHEARLGMT